jgi:hypothetical protein
MQIDALIIEMNQAWCYDMIEEYCDFLGKQLKQPTETEVPLVAEYKLQ